MRLDQAIGRQAAVKNEPASSQKAGTRAASPNVRKARATAPPGAIGTGAGSRPVAP